MGETEGAAAEFQGWPEAAASPEDQPKRIGRYLVLRTVGAGAMGVVYSAYDEELDRKVAVKLLHPAQHAESQLRARIIREAQALARVSAPNVVHVYEVGEHARQLFIVMEYIEGTTLAKWQSELGRTGREILKMYCAAGQGLHEAHEAGLVHRDFKPDNVLIGTDGRPRVVDFGLARLQDAESDQSAMMRLPFLSGKLEDSNPLATPLTQTGMVMGTPLYMSPEQHLGKPADSRSDQFSFCVALYEALYRLQPFAGLTHQELAINKVKGRLQPRPTGTKVPTRVYEVLLRGLSMAPEQRFPSMRELLAGLAIDPARDRATEPRVRRLLSGIIPAFVVASSLVRFPLMRLGVEPVTASIVGAAMLFVFTVLLPFRFWRVVQKNPFHRGIMSTGAAYTGLILSLHLVGKVLGLTLVQIMPLDLAALLWMSGIFAIFLPGLLPAMPISAVAAAIALYHPAWAEPIGSVVLPASVIAALLLWSRAVRLQVTTRKSQAERAHLR
jgi:serine/threonine-protein kinase